VKPRWSAILLRASVGLLSAQSCRTCTRLQHVADAALAHKLANRSASRCEFESTSDDEWRHGNQRVDGRWHPGQLRNHDKGNHCGLMPWSITAPKQVTRGNTASNMSSRQPFRIRKLLRTLKLLGERVLSLEAQATISDLISLTRRPVTDNT
jgi:hypothetical protein